jgi:hypothetical protein
MSCRRVGECLCPLKKNMAVTYASTKDFITAKNGQSSNSKSGTPLTKMIHIDELCPFS